MGSVRFPGGGSGRARRRGEMHGVAGLQRLGRAVDDPVGGAEAARHLDRIAEIPAELDRGQHRLVAGPEDGDLDALAVGDQRRRRQAQEIGIARNLEMHVAIGAGREHAVRILRLQLDQHAARTGLDRIRGRDQGGVELPAGILRQFEHGLEPGAQAGGEGLGHLDIDPDLVQVRDLEQLLPHPAAAVVDESTDVGLAGRDHAVERGDDVLERLERLQPADVGLGGVGDRLLRRRIARLLVDGLLRHRLRGDERAPALGRQDRKLFVGLGTGEIGLGLVELLIKIRRIDRGQYLAGRDMGADILVPALQIAADPRIDGGAVVGLNGAGQRQGAERLALLDLGQRHGRDRLLIGPADELRLGVGALVQAAGENAAGDDEGRHREQAQATGVWWLDGLRGHGALRVVDGDANQPWVGAVTAGGVASAGLRSRAWTRLNRTGTNKSVAQLANSRPPMTARPSGMFWPGSIAMGSMPMIIASAVISTGRNRVLPASSAAVTSSAPAARRSRAKLITSTLFSVATPMHMMAPVRAGTDRAVPVANSIHTMPASALGSAMMMTNGSSHDWKLITISR